MNLYAALRKARTKIDCNIIGPTRGPGQYTVNMYCRLCPKPSEAEVFAVQAREPNDAIFKVMIHHLKDKHSGEAPV